MTRNNLADLTHEQQVAAILTASEAAIRSAVGSLNSARRVNIGRKGGRPRAQDRCACGKFTSVTAEKRKHKCKQ